MSSRSSVRPEMAWKIAPIEGYEARAMIVRTHDASSLERGEGAEGARIWESRLADRALLMRIVLYNSGVPIRFSARETSSAPVPLCAFDEEEEEEGTARTKKRMRSMSSSGIVDSVIPIGWVSDV